MSDAAEMRLRKAGYRVTKQRTTIYQYLLSTDSHPTAEAIHLSVRHTIPQISLATVYKAVDALVDIGMVTKIQRGASSARYDAAIKDHAHCRCLRCDGVWDTPHDAMPHGAPETFEIVHINVEFVGYCADCRRQKLGLAPLNSSTTPRSSL